LPVEGQGLECLDDIQIVGKVVRRGLTFHLDSAALDKNWQDQGSSLNLSELRASLMAAGTYEILNCSCGDMGCANRWRGVKVWHLGRDVIWHDMDRHI
jgi:hypothetical protein